jgi:predicted metal-binding membrane protein
MSAMGRMQMPGGWTMAMVWMRMPGQTWPGATASFLGMWIVMMVLPSLSRCCGVTARPLADQARRASIGCPQSWVWATSLSGPCSEWPFFPLRIALAVVEMQQPALARVVPIAVDVVVLLAGFFQIITWKVRHLGRHQSTTVHCRPTLARPCDRAYAHRSQCCVGLRAILLVIGVMDLRAMAVVAAAITVERLAPSGERVARATGVVAVGAGLFLITRAAGLG